jgi:hypothetical protein
MLRTALFAIALLASSQAFAQPLPLPFPPLIDTRGTPEDQKACSGDARKLCRAYLGDDMSVLRCFQANREKLSPPCRAVLVKYGQ